MDNLRQGQLLENLVFLSQTADESLELSISVQGERRERGDVQLGGDLMVLLHIHLENQQPVSDLGIELLQLTKKRAELQARELEGPPKK